MGETLLPKRLALPVFCSDPLSSNAYATEEILLVLGVGGTALLGLTPWVAAVVVLLLVIVVASYRQTCHAYPNGGGAYTVSRENHGRTAALVAASALMVDYVLTVAVSVASGVANVVSAVPALAGREVLMCLGFIAVLTLMNLRGVKESGTAFAVPTYGFVLVVLTMLGVGLVRTVAGDAPVAASAAYEVSGDLGTPAGLLLVGVVLRAFASGCTALTGVEAISNGVPNFKAPKSRNAATTLAVMGALTVTMFVGITWLAMVSGVHVAGDGAHLVGVPEGYAGGTVISQLAAAVFGGGSVGFYLVQAFTAGILVLAANTAYNGFPVLAGLLAQDGFMPRQFARRGDRLALSNGIVILTVVAGGLVWVFDAQVSRLIQLYIIGVFVSFTLSQSGMVRRWTHELVGVKDGARRRSMLWSRGVNAVGTVFTAVVLVVVLVTKFTHGAWMVVVAVPLLVALMTGVHRHYETVSRELAPGPGGVVLPSRVHAVVLVSRLHTPALQALAFARATRPATVEALTVRVNGEETDRLVREWAEREVPVPLVQVDSPYRDLTGPVLEYVQRIRVRSPRDVVCVFVPEYVVGRWWENMLHNQSALRLKVRLLFESGVMVTSVPWRLSSAGGSGSSVVGPRSGAGAGVGAGV